MAETPVRAIQNTGYGPGASIAETREAADAKIRETVGTGPGVTSVGGQEPAVDPQPRWPPDVVGTQDQSAGRTLARSSSAMSDEGTDAEASENAVAKEIVKCTIDAIESGRLHTSDKNNPDYAHFWLRRFVAFIKTRHGDLQAFGSK